MRRLNLERLLLSGVRIDTVDLDHRRTLHEIGSHNDLGQSIISQYDLLL